MWCDVIAALCLFAFMCLLLSPSSNICVCIVLGSLSQKENQAVEYFFQSSRVLPTSLVCYRSCSVPCGVDFNLAEETDKLLSREHNLIFLYFFITFFYSFAITYAELFGEIGFSFYAVIRYRIISRFFWFFNRSSPFFVSCHFSFWQLSVFLLILQSAISHFDFFYWTQVISWLLYLFYQVVGVIKLVINSKIAESETVWKVAGISLVSSNYFLISSHTIRHTS